VDWNSRLITARGRLLRIYDDEKCCVIYGPNTPTSVPYSTSATPGQPSLAVIKVVNEALQTHSFAPASEPKLTIPTNIQDVIRVVEVGKAPVPNGATNKVLMHLPLSSFA
jgi:hypothetical protein